MYSSPALLQRDHQKALLVLETLTIRTSDSVFTPTRTANRLIFTPRFQSVSLAKMAAVRSTGWWRLHAVRVQRPRNERSSVQRNSTTAEQRDVRTLLCEIREGRRWCNLTSDRLAFIRSLKKGHHCRRQCNHHPLHQIVVLFTQHLYRLTQFDHLPYGSSPTNFVTPNTNLTLLPTGRSNRQTPIHPACQHLLSFFNTPNGTILHTSRIPNNHQYTTLMSPN